MKLKKGVKIIITDKNLPDFGEKYYILSKIIYHDDLWLYGKDLNQVMGEGYANSTQFEIITDKSVHIEKSEENNKFWWEID